MTASVAIAVKLATVGAFLGAIVAVKCDAVGSDRLAVSGVTAETVVASFAASVVAYEVAENFVVFVAFAGAFGAATTFAVVVAAFDVEHDKRFFGKLQ